MKCIMYGVRTLQCSNPGSGPHGDVPWFSQFTQKQRSQKPMLCQQPTREIHLTRWVTPRFRCDLKGDVESWALGHILNARAVVGEIHLPQCSDTRLSLGHSSGQFTHFIFAFLSVLIFFWYTERDSNWLVPALSRQSEVSDRVIFWPAIYGSQRIIFSSNKDLPDSDIEYSAVQLPCSVTVNAYNDYCTRHNVQLLVNINN